MSSPMRTKMVMGAAAWLAAAVGVTVALGGLSPAQRGRIEHVKIEMWRTLLEPAPTYSIRFAGGTAIERGNGVVAAIDGKLERVGEVVRVRRASDSPEVVVTVALDDRRVGAAEFRPLAGSIGVRRSQGNSFLFAVRTLLPAARMEQVRREWELFRARHAAELARELEPLAEELLEGALQAIAAELPDALARHRREIDLLLGKLQGELAGKPASELLAAELLPIVERHAAAPAEVIGRELWDRLPLMSFALRAAADRVLEDRPVRVEERWRQFVDEEALPVLREQRGAMETAIAAIARDAVADPELRDGLRRIVEQVQDDPLVQALARRMLAELVAENPHLAAWLRGLRDDARMRARVDRLSARLQEFLDPLGDLLFLDATGEGINPELAWLIRLLLLRRDAQVIHLEGGGGAPLEPGSELEGRHDA
ncbi:MAG: hypothetical protein JNL90_08190 [Planctomycetes bacterium]|nr:hypothetical protein [Planctomycetota bacterium]